VKLAEGRLIAQRVLRHPRRDRLEPRLALGRFRVKQDAADVPLAVEHVIIIVRPLAARVGFGSAF
jgi:hypothetical protein